MGRKLKRVPLDFDWPLNKVWGGYLNPFYQQSTKCPNCEGSGYSPEYRLLKDQWYGNAPFKPEDRGSVPLTPEYPPVRAFAERNIRNAPYFYGAGENAIISEAKRLCALWNKSWSHHINADDVAVLVAAGRLMDFTHTWSKDEGWKKKDPPYMPTPKEVNDWNITGFGHDSINSWKVVEAECKRLGYKTECTRCHGEGTLWPTAEIKTKADDWQSTEPPIGEGYQLWETVSEGSPISPVFKTPEELADYLVSSAYTWKHNDDGTTREQWLKFIKGPGWAMSGVFANGQFMTGVQAVTN